MNTKTPLPGVDQSAEAGIIFAALWRMGVEDSHVEVDRDISFVLAYFLVMGLLEECHIAAMDTASLRGLFDRMKQLYTMRMSRAWENKDMEALTIILDDIIQDYIAA